MAALQNWDPTFDELVEAPRLRLVQPLETTPVFRQGVPVRERVALRRAQRQKRNRMVLLASVLIALALLMVPGSAFGGTTGSGLPGDAALSGELASGMSYTVHSGDTLTSIAEQINPNNVPGVVAQLKSELGSSVVVPGERILIP